MSYSDWEKSIAYAKRYCEKESKRTGRDIRWKTYFMYDGREGIVIQLFDSCGHLFEEFMSGIHNSYMDMKDSLEIQIGRATVI